LKSGLIAIVTVFSAYAAEAPVRELTTQAVPFANSRIEVFRHGYLITFPPGAGNGTPASLSMYGFWAWAPDGSFVYQKSIEVPNASQPVVRDLDFNVDGTAVVAAGALGDQSTFLSGLLFLDRTGQQTRFAGTGSYFPGHLAIAPDGSIWTLGWQNGREDYRIVRQFSADGKELNAFLPRSSFPAGLQPGAGLGTQITVTRDRVDVVAHSGEAGFEWVELDWNGNILDRIRIGHLHIYPMRLAMTDDDRVFLSGEQGGLYELDRAAHTWELIRRKGPMFMGIDGKDLVFEEQRSASSGPITLQWLKTP